MPNARKIEDGSIWKICPTCKADKPIGAFSRCVTKTDGMQTFCKSCAKIRVDRYYAKYPERKKRTKDKWKSRNIERVRERRRLRQYRMDPGTYIALVERQGNRCALCMRQAADCTGKTLNVDHCHATGRVRGLLCKNCNLLLGHVGDSKETLSRMIVYLDDPS